MKTNGFIALVTFVVLSMFSVAGYAQDAAVRGEVKKIDEAAGKITLKHGPIKSLDMLKSVKVGDKVKFAADRVNGQITVTSLQKSK
jgi:Cu/Ag efflux protein CusF